MGYWDRIAELAGTTDEADIITEQLPEKSEVSYWDRISTLAEGKEVKGAAVIDLLNDPNAHLEDYIDKSKRNVMSEYFNLSENPQAERQNFLDKQLLALDRQLTDEMAELVYPRAKQEGKINEIRERWKSELDDKNSLGDYLIPPELADPSAPATVALKQVLFKPPKWGVLGIKATPEEILEEDILLKELRNIVGGWERLRLEFGMADMPTALEKVPLGGALVALFNQMTYEAAKTRLDSDWDYSTPVGFRDEVSERMLGRVTPRVIEGKVMEYDPYEFAEYADKESDERIVENYRRRKYAQNNWFSTVAWGISNLPTYMAEFAITGRIYTGVRSVGRRAGLRLLGTTKAGRFGARLLGWISGSTARGAIAFAPRGAEELAERRLEIREGIRPEESLGESIAKSWGNQIITAGAEVSGTTIMRGLAKLPFARKFVPALQKAWSRKTGGSPSKFVNKLLKRGEYSTLLGELAEEEVETIFKAIAGTEDFGTGGDSTIGERLVAGLFQDFQNLPSTGVVLAFPAAVRMAAGMMTKRAIRPPEPIKKPVETKPVAPEIVEKAPEIIEKPEVPEAKRKEPEWFSELDTAKRLPDGRIMMIQARQDTEGRNQVRTKIEDQKWSDWKDTERTPQEIISLEAAEEAERLLAETRPKLAKPEVPAEKHPWEMTINEFIEKKYIAPSPREKAGFQNIETLHKRYIRKALKEKKLVPREVLEEYKGEEWADKALAKMEKPEVPEKFGETNVIFKKTDAEAAIDRIKKKIAEREGFFRSEKGEQDIEGWGDLVTIGGYYFEGGLKSFEKWSEQLITTLGEKVRTHLSNIWDEVTKGVEVEEEVLEAEIPIEEKVIEKPKVKKPVALEEKPEEPSTKAQKQKGHIIAKKKGFVSEKGKMRPGYRALAKAMTIKKSMKDMTYEEAERFIDALGRLPEPTIRAGKIIPPSIPRTTKLATVKQFQRKYRKPTLLKYITAQTYYAEVLGVKELVKPLEEGKQRFDLEFRKVSSEVDKKINEIDKYYGTTLKEKAAAKLKNQPTKAVVKMRDLLNKHEEPPANLSIEEAQIFNWFRDLSKEILRRENEVRAALDLEPIKERKAYVRHVADSLAAEMLRGKYPFPEGMAYWAQRVASKKVFNPMEFQRKVADDVETLFTKDLAYATKSMLWSGLKEVHLSQPLRFFSEQLGAISKDLPIYKGLSAKEKQLLPQVMPAETKRWVIDYVNQVIKGQETQLDRHVNNIVTETGLGGLFNKILKPFGRTISRRPITTLFQKGGRLVISGVMGWRPKQLIRNKFQTLQNLALYGIKANAKSFIPASPQLRKIIDDSLFIKGYTGFEELPKALMGKLEKAWLAPYQWTAVSNATKAQKAAYWDTIELITNPKYKKYGWADPKRTYKEKKGFLYPSELEKIKREMDFGAGATQYQYIPMGMPEAFRHKALIPLTRLQSWWMNHFARFHREAIHRLLKGEPRWSDGTVKLPWTRRLGWFRYLVIGGLILNTLGYTRSFLFGAAPTGLPPAAQFALGAYIYLISFFTGDTDKWKEYKREKAKRNMYNSLLTFIPGYLSYKDYEAIWSGRKDLKSLFFYEKMKEEKPKKLPPYD